jgi:hypothetical protein
VIAHGRGVRGLTLIELMMSIGLVAFVLAASLSVMLMCMGWWRRSELLLRVSADASRTLERLVYGPDGAGGLREADGAQVTAETNGWTLSYRDGAGVSRAYSYNAAAGTIVYVPQARVLCRHVVFAAAETNLLGDGVQLRLDLGVAEGRYVCSNSMRTFVAFRNHHDD